MSGERFRNLHDAHALPFSHPNHRKYVLKSFEAVNDDVFKRDPVALLEIFLLRQQNPEIEGITATTLRLMRRDRKLLDQWREWAPQEP